MIRYQSTHFESIIESQNSVTDSVGRVFQMVNEIQATMVTREDMESRNVAIQRKPRLKYGRALRSSRNQEQEGTTVTRVEMSFEKYSLPIGEIRLAYRYKRELTDGKKNNGENFDWGAKWEFHPAPWISNRIFISQAMLQVKSGSALARPSISATLTGSMLLGQDHPIWENIDNMDLIGVQRLLSTGGVRINDYEGWGWTLLHYVGIIFQILSPHNS